jgi:Ca2+/Na+ antiporter
MIPSLLNIGKRYGLSKDVTGILVAVGNSVPEVSTTIISFMKHGVTMTEFGISSNVGIGAFAVSVIPAFAVLATLKETQYYEEKKKHLLASNSKKFEDNHRSMMLSIYRDMGFFIVALALYDILLYKKVIYLYEAIALACCTIPYVFVVI